MPDKPVRSAAYLVLPIRADEPAINLNGFRLLPKLLPVFPGVHFQGQRRALLVFLNACCASGAADV